MEDGEGEDGRVAVGVKLEYLFFYRLVVLFDGFAKEDRFIGFFNVFLPGRPEAQGAHAWDDIYAPHEALFEELPPDILGLTQRLAGNVDEDHGGHTI